MNDRKHISLANMEFTRSRQTVIWAKIRKNYIEISQRSYSLPCLGKTSIHREVMKVSLEDEPREKLDKSDSQVTGFNHISNKARCNTKHGL